MQPTAITSGARVNPLAAAQAKLRQAEKARLAGDLDRAQSIGVALLKEFPDYVAALHTVGLVLADRQRYDDALGYLHRAAMLYPDDPKTLIALSGVYLRLRANRTAARTLEQARRIAPDDVATLATLGEIYREEKEYELSKEAFETALRIDPSLTPAEIGLALDLMHIGQLEDAARIFLQRVAQGSREIGVLYNLSQLPSEMVPVDLVRLIEEVERPSKTSLEDFRIQLAFAKASIFDRVGRHDEAWEQVNEARRVNTEQIRQGLKRLHARYAPLLELTRNRPPINQPSRDAAGAEPISLFIIGPSRSGKTTLERLIGGIPGVKRGYENPIVENAVRRTFQASALPTRDNLIELPDALCGAFREHYRQELHERADGARVLTNTVPGRVDDALRAATEIRNARFIFIKRDVSDLSIRIFMRNYKDGNYYASDLREIDAYVRWCHRMMDVAASRMPGISTVLSYEEMVEDPRGALHAAAQLCGLEVGDAEAGPVGDDRGCSLPYRTHMAAVLGNS